MSRFLTCWHRAGASVPTRMIEAADRWLARDGHTAGRRLVSGEVACWHWPSAWAVGAEDALPLERHGWVGSGVLRLDDRRELVRQLSDRDAAAVGDDASLAWRSFAKWGDAAARHWIGDFALAAVAPGRERMVISRSAIGVRACFHTRIGEVTCASDDLGLLVELAGGYRAPADDAVGEYLRFGQLMSPTLTFHHGILRVPAAHTAVIGRDGVPRLTRHRELPVPELRYGESETRLIEEFRATLDAAVSDRLRGPEAVLMLSGGLDSPALALSARRAAPAVRLHAFTADWSRMIDDDELVHARLAATAAGLSHEVVSYAPDEGLTGGPPFRTPEPVPDVEPRVWRAQSERLARRAPIVLLGEDPDTLLASPTLTEQLRVSGVRRTAQAWIEYVRATRSRPWIGARRSFPAIERWRERRQARPPRWLRAPFASMGDAWERPPTHPTRALAARGLGHPLWDACAWADDPSMTGVDLTTLLPYMDTRVIEFCFSLPAVPWLQRKYLLRQAMRGELPPALLERRKTALSGYYEARVAAWRALGSPAPLPAPVDEWVDLGAWRDTLENASDADDVYAAWRVLELSRWLSQEGAR